MFTGTECRELRQLLGVSQSKLAWETGVDSALVSRWEAGVAKLRPVVVEKIRAYLDTRLEEHRIALQRLQVPQPQEENTHEASRA